MSGKKNIEFEKVSDLTAYMNFEILSNQNTFQFSIYFPTLMIKIDPPKKNNEKVKKMYQFFKKPSDEKEFEVQIIEDILEPYEH